MKTSVIAENDQKKSVVILYPDTNEEMAALEVAYEKLTDGFLTFKKVISDNKRVIAYEFWISPKK